MGKDKFEKKEGERRRRLKKRRGEKRLKREVK